MWSLHTVRIFQHTRWTHLSRLCGGRRLNENIERLLDEFTKPYHNDMVSDLVEKLELYGRDPKYVEDMKNYLIHKKGAYTLKNKYTKFDSEFVQTLIDEVLTEWEGKDTLCTCGHDKKHHNQKEGCTYQYPTASNHDYQDNNGYCVCIEFFQVEDKK